MDEKNKVYFIILDERVEFSEYIPLLELLTKERREEISRLYFDEEKKQRTISELFVRYLACRFINKKNEELIFSKNIYGKPFVQNTQNFCFNISHTKNVIAVAVSRTSIGVDVEHICCCDSRIVDRFFCPMEIEYVRRDLKKMKEHFCEIWTMKEAYIKWLGKGLSEPLNSFDVLDENLPCFFTTLKKEDYRISVCQEKGTCLDECVDIAEKVVYDKLMFLF